MIEKGEKARDETKKKKSHGPKDQQGLGGESGSKMQRL